MTGRSKAPELPGLDHFFSLGEAAFEEIITRVTAMEPETFLELGSGRSTVRFASALAGSRVFSVESGPVYAEETRALLDRHGIRNVTLIEAPIRRQFHGLALYDGFDLGEGALRQLPDPIDVLLIDGPPALCFGGREAALYALFDRVRTGGLVIVDDLFRRHEQRAIRHWGKRFPGAFEVTYSETGHQLAFLTKVSSPRFRRFTTVPLSHYRAALWGYVLKYTERWRDDRTPE